MFLPGFFVIRSGKILSELFKTIFQQSGSGFFAKTKGKAKIVHGSQFKKLRADFSVIRFIHLAKFTACIAGLTGWTIAAFFKQKVGILKFIEMKMTCLLYTSDAADDR